MQGAFIIENSQNFRLTTHSAIWIFTSKDQTRTVSLLYKTLITEMGTTLTLDRFLNFIHFQLYSGNFGEKRTESECHLFSNRFRKKRTFISFNFVDLPPCFQRYFRGVPFCLRILWLKRIDELLIFLRSGRLYSRHMMRNNQSKGSLYWGVFFCWTETQNIFTQNTSLRNVFFVFFSSVWLSCRSALWI